MSMTLIHTVGHISFVLTAFSFYVRDILMLRALAIVSGIFGVFYSFNITVAPLWLTIFWLCVFMSINGVRIFNILRERQGVSFTEEEQELFGTIFRQFAPVEFHEGHAHRRLEVGTARRNPGYPGGGNG